jgi:Tol biopolymer transport system component
MSLVPVPIAPSGLVLAALLAAGSAVGAQDELVSRLPHRTTGGVLDVFQAGERVVYATAPAQLGMPEEHWSVPLDRSSPPVLLHAAAQQGDVHELQLTPDGTWALLRVQQNRSRLRAVRTDGSAPGHFISNTQPGDVTDFAISPDSARVVYRVDTDANGVFELWTRPVDNSAPLLRVSGPMVGGGDATVEFRISPDGAWVVYLADQDANDVFDLYATPLDGSGPSRRLNTSRPLADVQPDFVVAFDSLGVVYRADQDTDEVIELYGVRIDGLFGSFKRSGPLVTGGDVTGFELSRVDDRVVYRADQGQNDRFELYSVAAIAGGVPVRLDGPLVAGGDVQDFRLAPDAGHVVYRADQDVDGRPELYAVPAVGGTPAVKVHADLPAGRNIPRYEPSPDGESVLFVADLEERTALELHRAPLDGSAPAERIVPDFDPGAEVSAIAFGAGGDTVVYLADVRGQQLTELYAVPADGSAAPVHLNRDVVTGGRVGGLLVTPDGTSVVYPAQRRDGLGMEVFRADLGGATAPVLLSDPWPRGQPEGDVVVFELGPAEGEASFSTFAAGNLATWTVSLDGPARLRRVSGPAIDEGWSVTSPDGRYMVFQRPARTSFTRDVLARRVDGSGEAWLDRGVPVGASEGFVYGVEITPDSTHAVFGLMQEIEGVIALYSAPLDGSQGAVRLDTHVGVRFALSPDSTRVAYLREGLSTNLFVAALDGGSPPVRVNAPLGPGGSVGAPTNFPSFAFTPDGAHIVYVGQQDETGVMELYSAPADGSAPPTELSGPLVVGGDVRTDSFYGSPFHLSLDGAWVLYVADQDVDESFELYRAPVLGGSSPVKLSGTLVPGGTVGGAYENNGYVHQSLLLSPDGQWVVYMADAAIDQTTELYAVPLDGSAAPVQLSAPLPAGGDVYDFRIDPTSSRVLYRAFDGTSSYQLHSAPVDGGAPSVLLAASVTFHDSARGYEATPDGTRVVFTAPLASAIQLFVRPIDASAPATVLNGPLVADGDVSDEGEFLILPDGTRVLYLADQDVDGRVELYQTFLERTPRGAPAPGRTVYR